MLSGRGSRGSDEPARAEPRRRRAADRAHRGVVAVRVLDGRDGRARGRRWTTLDDDRRVRHLRPGRRRRRRGHLRPAGGARRGDPRRRGAARLSDRGGDRGGRRGRRGRGMRIVPQIRRQLPEGWRWTMPLPLAAGLYGVLLGLGFTTFVLSFGVWALAGISVALGDPEARNRDRRRVRRRKGDPGGRGRARRGHARSGNRCIELMAERPSIYRLFRLGDAVTLGLVAAALTSTASATAARTEVPHGADPSAAGKALAFQRADRAGFLRFEGHTYDLPGRDPASAVRTLAVISGRTGSQILNRFTRQRLAVVQAPGARSRSRSLATGSRTWRSGGGATCCGRGGSPTPLTPATPRGSRRSRVPTSSAIRASADAASSTRSPSGIGTRSSATTSSRARRERWFDRVRSSCSIPRYRASTCSTCASAEDRSRRSAIHPRRLHQTLMVKRLGRHGAGHKIYSRGRRGTLWTTALAGRHALVTVLGRGGPKIVSTHR